MDVCAGQKEVVNAKAPVTALSNRRRDVSQTRHNEGR